MIAAFMGIANLKVRQYHTNWSELMPVVEKIENLDHSKEGYTWIGHEGEVQHNFTGYLVDIEKTRCYIDMELQLDPPQAIANCEAETKIEAVWLAVYQFVEYFNGRFKDGTS